jgi:DNA-binding MarR family transcriptional regulator
MIILRDLPNDQDLRTLAGRYPDLDPEATAAFLAFMRAACEIFHASDEHFARYGTSCGRFTVLALLNRQPDRALTPSQIAGSCGVTRATITGLLDGLEADGLIKRTRNDGDRRSLQVSLTTGGRRFLDGMLPDHFRRMAKLMGELDDEERQALRRISAKIAAGVTHITGPAAKPNRRSPAQLPRNR